ncbi:MAG: NUDIX hydrolase [Candidatus Pacebacteria bacterium]|nr:NUDIX hydrolase [Candidatus Paceibacterota bacterium]
MNPSNSNQNSTTEDLKAQYPDIDINMSGGADTYQEGLPIVERDPIAVIIKHPTDDLYLIAQWKNNWNGFLTGGIEEGDTLEQTVQKEIHEETGFKNIGLIKPLDYVSHGLFFHIVKKVNRLAHYHLVYAELTDLEQDTVSEEELAIAQFNWIPKSEVLDTLSRSDMKSLWKYYLNK